jgi:hypothetical protein
MFLKRRTRTKDGKTHIYYSVCESLRVSRDRVVQRQILHLGELNTTQIDSWQHSIDVLHEDGQRRQLRLFTDRDQSAPNDPDVVEVKLSSFAVKSPRRLSLALEVHLTSRRLNSRLPKQIVQGINCR